MFPKTQNFAKASIFDKNYILFTIMNAKNLNQEECEAECEMKSNY